MFIRSWFPSAERNFAISSCGHTILRMKGQDIPVEARIIAVADAVEAMASDRPSRQNLSY